MKYAGPDKESPYDMPVYWFRNDNDRRFWYVNFCADLSNADRISWFKGYPIFVGVTDDFGNLVRVQ